MGKSKYNELTNEALLNMLRDYHDVHGKAPTSKEACSKNCIPSSSFYFKRFNTNSWNKILELAGLELNHFQGHNNKDALTKLEQYYNILGRIPKSIDFEENNWLPSYNYYAINFGSFKNACCLVGLCEKPLTTKERIEVSIQELQNIAKKLNKCPTVLEYDKMRGKGFSRRVLSNHLGMSYNEICKKYISSYSLNVDNTITKEELIQHLADVRDKLGRSPTFKELKEHGVTYTYKVFKRVLGKTYNEIIQDLGWDISGKPTNILKDREQLLDEFYQLFIELKRIPYVEDMNSGDKTASYTTYLKYFGSIENVCELLNINYEEHYQGAGAGKIVYDKLGNLCKSYPERDISNFLIDNYINFKKEIYYKDVIDTDNTNRRMDWEINIGNKSFYVEYFGMHNKKPRGNIGKRYAKKAKKKIKDLYKADLIDQCIFIFPWDMKNRSLEDIFKPILELKSDQKCATS